MSDEPETGNVLYASVRVSSRKRGGFNTVYTASADYIVGLRTFSWELPTEVDIPAAISATWRFAAL